MGDILGNAVSGLLSFQRALSTTSHNIANVNTEGYSRQRVELDTRTPQATTQGYIGAGVDVTRIRRNYDEYLSLRVRDYTSLSEESLIYDSRAREVDDLIADGTQTVTIDATISR